MRLTRIAILTVAVGLAGCAAATPVAKLPQSAPLVRAAKGQALLYVSLSYYSTVNVYTYPQGNAMGSLSISGVPEALCTDERGNVFIPESYGGIVAEYAHGGTEPIATFADRHTPNACAIDPTTGNLAVANGDRSIAIFSQAAAAPAFYSTAAVESYDFAAYDARGNLFTVVYTFSSGYQLYEVSKGSPTPKPVTLPFNICCPEPIQWDGTYLAIEASQQSGTVLIDRLKVNNYKATVAGKVTLDNAESYTSQFWIDGTTLVKPNDYSQALGFYKYPAGGKAWRTISNAGPDIAGVTVSNAPK